MRLDKPRPDDGRFAPRDRPANAIETPQEGPVVVQVQLRAPVEPNVINAQAVSNFKFSSPSGVDLSGFHRTAGKYGLLKAEPSFRPRRVLTENNSASGETSENNEKKKFVDLHFPAGTDAKAVVAELRGLAEVELATVMPKAIPPNAIPTDPLVGNSDQVAADPATGLENEWYVFRCGAHQAWGQFSGHDVIIADIDFGFLITHQDLAPNLDLSHAHNSVDGTTNVSAGDFTDHGTAVLGLAAASSNSVGMAGFAYEASIWPIQANTGEGPALPGDAFANAIDWVTSANTGGKCVVINLEVQTATFGNYEVIPAVNFAIRNAISKGIVVCVAAGNGNKDAGLDDEGQPIPPSGSILVGATQFDANTNVRAWFSNYGSRVVVSAPGDQDHDVTCSNGANDAYRNGFGETSGATPKVSGTIALMLEANPSLTHEQVKQILMATGTAISVNGGKPVGVFLKHGSGNSSRDGSLDGECSSESPTLAPILPMEEFAERMQMRIRMPGNSKLRRKR